MNYEHVRPAIPAKTAGELLEIQMQASQLREQIRRMNALVGNLAGEQLVYYRIILEEINGKIQRIEDAARKLQYQF